MVALLFFSICGYVLAPFSFGDTRVLVPQDPGIDAIQESLLVARGMDKLLSDPRSYYDTAILYPDRNQLRTTEPFLGFAILGLPLRTILRLNDADVFEALRWAIVFTSLIYAYLLFRASGIDIAMSVAGAVLCLSQPDLLNGIERLQIVSIPLIFPVLYHCIMVWTSRRFRHSVGLFVFAALYPLCGMVNATLSVMAVLFILPLLLKTLAAQQRQKRLPACLLPILLAAVLDVLALAPWLLDRSDLAVYVSDAFLQIKRWYAVQVPMRVEDILGFVTGRIGLGAVAALAVLCVLIPIQHLDRTVKDAVRQSELPPPTQKYLVVVCVVALGLAISSSYHSGRLVVPWLQLVFHITCYVTLLLYWRGQILFSISNDQNGIRNYVVMLSAGVGVFLCLMSFGPVYVSNNSPLANHIMSALLYVLPPLKSLREFHRLWTLGLLFLSVYVTVRLGMAVRLSAPITRVGAAVAIVVAAMSSVYNRQVVASVNIEAPRDFVELASHSRGTGGMYVHPYMRWNTLSGVWMIPIAKELGRPIVNGYLGILPPWFTYASSVLHRFPDPESVWLLRKWKVDTVVSLVGNVGGEESAFVDKVFENQNGGVVYEIAAPPEDIPHP
jgi:hypothetical protein